jgi:hypothetical protein
MLPHDASLIRRPVVHADRAFIVSPMTDGLRVAGTVEIAGVDWISFYNNRRPHQALAMRTPAEAFRLAA